MKKLFSHDQFKLGDEPRFTVKRTHPWSDLAKGEMPLVGEEIELDGVRVKVTECALMSGSFGWRPEFVLAVSPVAALP